MSLKFNAIREYPVKIKI